MTRVVTGAALLGLLQGVVALALLGPLGLDGEVGGWFFYTGSYARPGVATVGFEATPDRWPRVVLPLVMAVLAAGVAAVTQARGWWGGGPAGGAVAAGRVGAVAVLAASVGHVLAHLNAAVVSVGSSRMPRRYSDYGGQDGIGPSWDALAASLAVAVVLVLLVGLRERRRWAWWSLAAVLVMGVLGVAAQVLVLGGVPLVAFGGEVLGILLGGAALGLARRSPS